MNQKILSLLSILLLGGSSSSFAAVTLPYLIGDGMVVQRDEPVRLWGKAEPGEEIRAFSTAGKKSVASAIADSSGNWSLTLPKFPVGGPYQILIKDIVINDVLSGDVFLCSGQSNMELPVYRVTDMFADEIASYENNKIREFKVPQVTSFHGPLENTSEAYWKSCNRENVMDFSALAYFFAKQLNSTTGVPVGIINSSWGGTPVESWTCETTMEQWPETVAKKRIYEDDGYRNRSKTLEGENYYRWNNRLYADDPGLNSSAPWFAPATSDDDWEEVDLIASRWGIDNERGTKEPVNGSHWLRKHISLSAPQSKGDAVLRMGCIEGADSAYVNGVFVGTVGYQYPPRIYRIPDGTLKEGDNIVTVRVISQNGEPKCVPEKPYKLILADGEEISLEGNWKHHIGARMPQGPNMIFWHYTPVVLYDAMINPLFNYPVSGVVWYQGESNVSNRYLYPDMLSAMIADWRKGFGRDNLPFYIVELADFLHPSDVGGRNAWSEMRAAQALVAEKVPSAWLIKNSDLGEWNDIHPLDKKTLGNRVAEAVLNNMKK